MRPRSGFLNERTRPSMNDPAPAFERTGWVCGAFGVGLLVGGAIAWQVRGHFSPQLAATTGASVPAAGSALIRATTAAAERASGDSASTGPVAAGNHEGAGAAGAASDTDAAARLPSRLGASLVPGDSNPAGATPSDTEDPHSTLALAPVDGEHLLHGHPKAEGCLGCAIAALAPFTKQGFNLREKVWVGDVTVDEGKAVSCQLFKGNDYCFSVGTDVRGVKLSLQVYSGDGAPVESEQATHEAAAGADATASLHCPQTGTYFVVVKLDASAQGKVPWGMVSAYR